MTAIFSKIAAWCRQRDRDFWTHLGFDVSLMLLLISCSVAIVAGGIASANRLAQDQTNVAALERRLEAAELRVRELETHAKRAESE